jgi:hypothetical protein
MSKIRRCHRKYDTRKWCGTKHELNRAKVWPTSHITLVGQPCVGAIPKTVLSTCPAEVVLKVSNAQRRCKKETWSPDQVAWLASLTSAPHTPNLWPEHRLTPINTTVLPLAERVKKVRFSVPKGRRTSWLIGSPRSRSSVEALPESIRVRRSFPSSGSVKCGSSAGILRIPTESRPSSPSGVSRFWLVGIPMTIHRSGRFANHSKLFIHFSYDICAFMYRIVELVFVLSYIWFHVWGSIWV